MTQVGVSLSSAGATLSSAEIDAVAKSYDPLAMGQLLSATLVALYSPTEHLLRGIGDALYPEFAASGSETPLTPACRERCLVALLASRTRTLELAIHVYMAIANGVAPDELRQILLVVAAYTGIDTAANGFRMLETTLQVLKACAKNGAVDPQTVLGALAQALS